ncbi:MAG: DNA-3-methyladenine glycosylase I [Hahellaceae bacterium]|nr:DNA-3-methyladenine glycosylase I [Hahellaceae bacterium]MCP5209997.1 DNA-3-methyladenine glycosylase I [Hahellaceae bacterium]
MSDTLLNRCTWCGNDADYQHYHDTVWGRPVSCEQDLFKKLCLDGQQAGLSWITILRKQTTYEAAYADFDPEQIARFDEEYIAGLMHNPGIVRNRLKIHSIIRNARSYLAMKDAGLSFNEFLWGFVDFSPVQNQWQDHSQIPANSVQSDAMSKALKKRGFNFVGSTICYAFMQATGMVNDHVVACHCYEPCRQKGLSFSL